MDEKPYRPPPRSGSGIIAAFAFGLLVLLATYVESYFVFANRTGRVPTFKRAWMVYFYMPIVQLDLKFNFPGA